MILPSVLSVYPPNKCAWTFFGVVVSSVSVAHTVLAAKQVRQTILKESYELQKMLINYFLTTSTKTWASKIGHEVNVD